MTIEKACIQIQNASLKFGSKLLFKNLHLNVIENKWTCLLGPSGIGKTTLLRLIANLPSPNTQFSATILSPCYANLSAHVAYMPQKDLLFPWLTALDNVLIADRLTGNVTNRQRGEELLSELGLAGSEKLFPHQLSGGMKQRVALARTLIQNKPIILMDEPFSAVDAITRFKLQNFAAGYLQHHTVLFITHDPYEALRLADNIIIMSGQPAQLNTPITIPQDKPRDITQKDMIDLHQDLLTRLAQGEMT